MKLTGVMIGESGHKNARILSAGVGKVLPQACAFVPLCLSALVPLDGLSAVCDLVSSL